MNSLKLDIKSSPNEEQEKLFVVARKWKQFIGHPFNCLFTVPRGQNQPHQNNYSI